MKGLPPAESAQAHGNPAWAAVTILLTGESPVPKVVQEWMGEREAERSE